MRTKIVYVATSTGDDTFIEQTYLSAWSCRQYNPEAKIVIVTDEDSMPFIQKYNELNDFVSEFITVQFEPNVSKAERSRFLKTSLRRLVKGDFLYVDGDTVFCQNIDEIDDFNFDIALVRNNHTKSIYKGRSCDEAVSRIILTFNILPPKDTIYFNGGVIYVKDNLIGHDFFTTWHQNWLYSNKKTGLLFDQPPLVKTILKYKDYVKELPGIYNAMIARSDKYLKDGKILHFFHFPGADNLPFMDDEYYRDIKNNLCLTDKIKTDVLNSKKIYKSGYLTKRFDFLPKGLAKILRKIKNYYEIELLGNVRYVQYKKFHNNYLKALNHSKIVK